MRSRKIFVLTGVFILFVFTTLLAIRTYHRVQSKNNYQKIVNAFNLPLTGLDDLPLNLPKSKGKILLILFEPGCEDCHSQAIEINKNLKYFTDCEVIWVTDASLDKIIDFYETHNLKSYNTSSMFMARIKKGEVYETFGSLLTPSLFIYSNNGQLLKVFKGETKIDAILEYIQ